MALVSYCGAFALNLMFLSSTLNLSARVSYISSSHIGTRLDVTR